MRQRLPRRKAANQALAKRENQGNLAPVENGGRFLSGHIYSAHLVGPRPFRFLQDQLDRPLDDPYSENWPWE